MDPAVEEKIVQDGLEGSLLPGNTTTDDHQVNPYFYFTEQLVVLWFLFFMIVIGNGSVLLTLAFTKNRKSRMNYFIMHLAIADLLVGLLNVLTDIAWKLTVEWHAGVVVCKLVKYLEAVVTFSSTYVLVALSIDRYDAIKHPMKFCGSWRRARIMVALAWLLSLLFSIPNLILFKEQMVEGINQCWIELTDWEWQVYMSLLMSAVFAIPAVIITACYAVIVSTIWRKGNRASILATAPRHRFKEKHKLEENETRRASSRGLIPRAKVKTIKMTFVIVFVFILCWSPYFLFNVLQVYGYVPKTQTFIAISTFIQSLAPLNSAANPIIYCLFSARLCRNFRRWRFLRWGGWWQPAPTDFNSTLTSSLTYSTRRATLTSSAVKTNRLSRSDRSRAVTVL